MRAIAISSLLALGVAITAPAAADTPSIATSTNVITAYSLAAPSSTARSGIVARAVVPGGVACPTLDVVMAHNGADRRRTIPMSERRAPATTAPAFESITVCSAHMPTGSVDATVAGRSIPSSMPIAVDKLALFGDSGCRIVSYEVQDCADTQAWPLSVIAASIAREEPDAVLYTGDFFYREAACPEDEQDECGSSPAPVTGLPFTDSAYGWIADVLLPMTPMLATAPLVVTRGNHEACYRGGNGYFLLFDPRDGMEATCAPVVGSAGLTAAPTVPTPTYAIDVPIAAGRTLRLAIVDSAGGSDTSVTSFAAQQRPAYQRAADLTRQRAGRESWLLTHRPIYGYVTSTFAQPGIAFSPWTSADQTAAATGLLGTFDMVLSGHVHIAQTVQLPGLPGQLVLGNSGTLLDPAIGYPLPTTAPAPGYPSPSWAWVAPEFGYAIATPNADDRSWRISMRAPSGSQFARCGLNKASLYCRS